jgi:hypothetical protein
MLMLHPRVHKNIFRRHFLLRRTLDDSEVVRIQLTVGYNKQFGPEL